jgi:hypothetical protein
LHYPEREQERRFAEVYNQRYREGTLTAADRAEKERRKQRVAEKWPSWAGSGGELSRFAIRLFRASVEPKAATEADRKWPRERLTPEEESWLALALLWKCHLGLETVTEAPPPSAVTKFDQLYLKTRKLDDGENEKRPMIEYYLGFLDEKGQFDPEIGASWYLRENE